MSVVIDLFDCSKGGLAKWLEQYRDRDDVQILAVDTVSLGKIRELADAAEGAVRFQPNMPEHVQRLLAVLGVPVLFDEAAPDECPCGCAHRGNDRTISLRGRA